MNGLAWCARRVVVTCWIFSNAALLHAATCRVDMQALDFGRYSSPAAGVQTRAQQVLVVCNSSKPEWVHYEILLSRSSPSAWKKLQHVNGIAQADYMLYLDPEHSTPWGDASAGTATIKGSLMIASGSARALHTVFGVFRVSPNSVAGQYEDELLLKLRY